MQALGPFNYFELHSLSFVQRLKAIILNLSIVDENILTTIDLDEAITFLGVEPLDFTFSHAVSPFYKIRPQLAG